MTELKKLIGLMDRVINDFSPRGYLDDEVVMLTEIKKILSEQLELEMLLSKEEKAQQLVDTSVTCEEDNLITAFHREDGELFVSPVSKESDKCPVWQEGENA